MANDTKISDLPSGGNPQAGDLVPLARSPYDSGDTFQVDLNTLINTLSYQTTWNAATNTPTLPSTPIAGTTNQFWVVSTPGTQFTISFDVGDWLISSNGVWSKINASTFTQSLGNLAFLDSLSFNFLDSDLQQRSYFSGFNNTGTTLSQYLCVTQSVTDNQLPPIISISNANPPNLPVIGILTAVLPTNSNAQVLAVGNIQVTIADASSVPAAHLVFCDYNGVLTMQDTGSCVGITTQPGSGTTCYIYFDPVRFAQVGFSNLTKQLQSQSYILFFNNTGSTFNQYMCLSQSTNDTLPPPLNSFELFNGSLPINALTMSPVGDGQPGFGLVEGNISVTVSDANNEPTGTPIYSDSSANLTIADTGVQVGVTIENGSGTTCIIHFNPLGFAANTQIEGTENQVDISTAAGVSTVSISPTLELPGTLTVGGYVMPSSLGSPGQFLAVPSMGNQLIFTDGGSSVSAQLYNLGTWNASTNTPTLSSTPSVAPNSYYVVAAAGTQFGISFSVGDWIISAGSAWLKIPSTSFTSSLGTAAFGTLGTAANNVVQIDGSGNLPPVPSGNTTLTDPTTSATNSLQATINNVYAAVDHPPYIITESVVVSYTDINSGYLVASPPSGGRLRMIDFVITGSYSHDLSVNVFNGATNVNSIAYIPSSVLSSTLTDESAVTAYNFPAGGGSTISFANGWNQLLPVDYVVKLIPDSTTLTSGTGYVSFTYSYA